MTIAWSKSWASSRMSSTDPNSIRCFAYCWGYCSQQARQRIQYFTFNLRCKYVHEIVCAIFQAWHIAHWLRVEVGCSGQLRKSTCLKRCIEVSIENWQRLPRALIAKAWIKTGHISIERMCELADMTAEEITAASKMKDPTSLADIIGEHAAQGPGVDELLARAQMNRDRVLWQISVPDLDAPNWPMLPEVFITPVERRLCDYLWRVLLWFQNCKHRFFSIFRLSYYHIYHTSWLVLAYRFCFQEPSYKCVVPSLLQCSCPPVVKNMSFQCLTKDFYIVAFHSHDSYHNSFEKNDVEQWLLSLSQAFLHQAVHENLKRIIFRNPRSFSAQSEMQKFAHGLWPLLHNYCRLACELWNLKRVTRTDCFLYRWHKPCWKTVGTCSRL